jgi:hypothetical protein
MENGKQKEEEINTNYEKKLLSTKMFSCIWKCSGTHINNTSWRLSYLLSISRYLIENAE